MAWLSGWLHRKQITINNTGSALSDFQLKFTVNRSSGSDSGFTVYVDTDCESDYDDIRFTKADGSTLLDYWIESSSSSTATIWVEVDSIAGSGNTTLYLYYGNAVASAVSNGDNTFPFFDDFPGSAIDANKWEGNTGNAIVSGGRLYFAPDNNWKYLNSKSATWNRDIGLRVKAQFVNRASSYGSIFGLRTAALGANYLHLMYYGTSTDSDFRSNTPSTSNDTNTDTSNNIYDITWLSTGYSAYKNGVEMTGSPISGTTLNTAIPISIESIGTGYGIYLDYIFIRKFAATKPTISEWGSEEDGCPKTIIGKYSIFQSKEIIGKYDILCTPKTIIGKYTIILTPVPKELIGKYQIWAGSPIIGKYGISQSKELIGKYGISASSNIIGKYSIFGSKSLIGKYSIFASQSIIGKYGISGGSSLTGRYRIDEWVHFTWIQKVEYTDGASEIIIGETLTGDTSGASGPVYMVAINSGHWADGDAEGYLYVEAPTGLPFTPGEYLNGSISGDSCAIVADRDSVWFSDGDTAFTPGETITGGSSGATATVVEVIVTSGSWATGDAEGYIVVEDLEGEFEEEEEISGSVSGPTEAVVDLPPSLENVKAISITASRSIDQLGWTAQMVLDGIYSAGQVANYKDTLIQMPDHTGTYQDLCLCFIPDYGVTQNPDENTTTVNAFSHDLYLILQYVPEELRSSLNWDPITETVSNIMPDVLVTGLLGGTTLWNATTGIKPYWIIPSADYGDTIPIKKWSWRPKSTKWQAIQDMADYLNYVYDTIYYLGNQSGFFTSVDNIDTDLPIPADVTFTDPDPYIISVSKENKGREKFNRIRVQGKRNYRIIHFDAGVTEFTAGHTVVDGGTGAEATIVSCTKTSGAWGGTAVGYLIISYDRTGLFINDNTIIDELGAAGGEAVVNGYDEPYEQFDIYNYAYPETAPTRPREKFEELDETYDSTNLIEARAVELFNFYSMDATPYVVVLRDRCDLRPWQRVKLVGYSGIPEVWMRIVSIQYQWFDGGDVRVTATLNNAAYVTTQRKLYRSQVDTMKDQIEIIAQELIERFVQVDDAEVLKVEGEFGTVALKDGEVVVIGKGLEG